MNYKLAFALGLIAPGVVGREQWETVYEGSVTVDENTNSEAIFQEFVDGDALWFYEGDIIRLTVDGESYTHKAVFYAAGEISTGSLASHMAGYDSYQNGSTDYYVATFTGLLGHEVLNFHSRTPGTYNVKIERAVSV